MKNNQNKLQEIEILRAISIIMVLFGHLPFSMPNLLVHGYTGVTLFFVISGYVVTKSFLSYELITGSFKQQILSFYRRRFFRIAPAALAWIGIYFLIAQLLTLSGSSYGTNERWEREVAWFLSGIYNYQFAFSKGPGLFGQYWSLFVEMHFYFVLPIILIIFRKNTFRILVCLIIFLIITLIARPSTKPEFAGLLTHSQADALLAGVLIYLTSQLFNANINIKTDFAIKISKFLIFITLALALFFLPSSFDSSLLPSYKYPIYVVLAAGLVFIAQLNVGWVSFGNKTINNFLIYVGSRSYSIYLSHIILFSGMYPGLYLANINSFPDYLNMTLANKFVATIVLFTLALIFGDLSYRLIERPFFRFGKRHT